MAVVLAEAVLHNISGFVRDDFINTFVFEDATLAAAKALAVTAVTDFYKGATGGGHKVEEFISQTVSRTVASEIKVYDISTHLDGGAHGSPVQISTFTLAAPVSAVDIPSEVAVCMSYHSDMTGLLEEGPLDIAIPTPAEAVHFGAPAAHTGHDRPRARHRGRIYVGPLSFGAVKTSGGAQCTVADNLVAALHDAGLRLLGLTGANWRTWSRRDAAVYTATGGFIDNEFDTQRRRRVNATTRTTFGS